MRCGLAGCRSNRQGGAHVGNLLGADKPRRARVASLVLLALVASIASVEALGLIAFRRWWGRLFTDDDTIVQLVAESLPMVALQV